MSPEPGPFAVRDRLAVLLRALEDDPTLGAELERAKREFFGADVLTAASSEDREERAIRFAEWYLCERPSDVLAAVPVQHERLGGPDANSSLVESVVGVFLVQSTTDGTTVRDLTDQRAFDLLAVPEQLEIGDVLIGRLFATDRAAETYVPSAAMGIVSGSPNFAVAFQRDLKNLGLGRRLTQAELEHLLFRSGATVNVPSGPPLEHLEAELDKILVTAGKSDAYTAFQISDALRNSQRPGAMIESLLDEMAFETDVDLDALRHLLLSVASAAQATSRDPTESDGDPVDEVPVKIDRAVTRREFEVRPEEPLGAQLARRLEQGLADHEKVEDVFADIENLLDESLDEEDEERDTEVLDDGDLDPLVREFVWESGADESARARLDDFVALQRAAPVPRATLESIEADDILRFLLQTWMASPPERRVAELRESFGLLDRFYRWADEVQGFDRIDELRLAKEQLVDAADRLDAASRALGNGSRPRGRAELFAVVGVEPDGVVLQVVDSDQEVRVSIDPSHADRIMVDDLIVGTLDRAGCIFDGMVVIVPSCARHLLG